jgi:hypothetical protein
MLMPKATSDINDLRQPREYKIRLSRKFRAMEPISVTHPVHNAANG